MNAPSNESDPQFADAIPVNVIPLKDCPASPNCVCTVASRPAQSMPSIAYECSDEQVIELVVETLSGMPRVEIVSREPNYLHAVFRTRFFRFADDVEFYAEAKSRQLHFRSASRLGYSDLGVNRKRMEQLSQQIAAHLLTARPTSERAP